ncbi:glutamate 5-kinase [bacterium]|nr:glutamate 5-kinase [bacterium]
MKETVVVKVGTHILGRSNGRLNYNRISDLVEQIIKLRKTHRIVLVSSGAIMAGKEFCEFSHEKDPLKKRQMLAAVGQGRLFQVYSDFFREYGVITAQALITFDDFRQKESYDNIKNALEGILDNNIMPIINENDVVSFSESTFGDNDQLASLTASMLSADLMILLSDIVGFYTADPKKDPNAKLIKTVEQISSDLLSLCEDSLSDGGTGGMLSKLRAADLASQHGIPTIVCSGKEKDSIIKAVGGQTSGTYFKPSRKKSQLSIRGKWMMTAANIKGTITIDSGAESALDNKKSLLAVGVISVKGNFAKRDVVLIKNSENSSIGAGLANFPAEEIRKYIKAKEKPKGVIVIHKNHLYTL